MKLFIGKHISTVLVVSFIIGPIGVYAQEAGLETKKDSSSLQSELKWREDIKKAKETRTSLLVGGGIVAVGGFGAMVAGNLKADSASEVDGCQREGLFTVTCNNQKSVDEAQDRIDSGRQIMLVGMAISLVGVAFLVAGSNKSAGIKNLERKGSEKGYKLSLDQTNEGRVRLLMVKAF